MTIHNRALSTLAVSTFLATMALGAAHAQDATAVADSLKAAAAKQSIDISWTNVTGDAASMVIEGVSVKPVGEATALPIGNVTLTGVTQADGGLHVETLTTSPFSKAEDGVALDLSPIVIKGMNIPSEGNTDPVASIMIYDSFELASMTVKMADKTAFAMEGLGFEMTAPADGKPLAFTGAADKFSADLSLVGDPQSKAVIDALGYQNISGSMELAGSWQPTDGQMVLSQYDMTVDNGGTLGMTFDMGGYTPDFIKSMQDVSKKMAEAPAGGDNSAQGMAMLGLMQQLTLNGASITFDDDSLTGKVLDFVGKQQGMSASDIANQAKAIVPFLTGQLNNPELATQISTAVNAYLDNPKNLEIAAEPAAPVPFAAIAAAGMGNPLELTKTLGVTVTANQ